MEQLTCWPGILLRPQGLLSFSVLNAYFADFLAYLFGDFNDLFFSSSSIKMGQLQVVLGLVVSFILLFVLLIEVQKET